MWQKATKKKKFDNSLSNNTQIKKYYVFKLEFRYSLVFGF